MSRLEILLYGASPNAAGILKAAESDAMDVNADGTVDIQDATYVLAYYAADSTRLLQKSDFDMASLVLCYPWTTGLDVTKLEEDFPPTLFVLSGQDPISQKAKNFVKDMETAGLEIEVIEYENAVHSFIESNNPEGMVEGSVDMSEVINPEQESLAREAETAISEWIKLQ